MSKAKNSSELPEINYSTLPAFLNEKQMALISGMSVGWLRKARSDGKGPKFIRIDNKIRYHIDDWKKWVAQQPRRQAV